MVKQQAGENKSYIIYNKLKEDIQTGVYQPNERITEADLADKFNTSRNTIRNVLSLLEKDNFITLERHKGARIVSLNLKDIINLYELRAEVEGYIFRKAVPNMTEEDIKLMTDIYKKMEERVNTDHIQEQPDLNIDFHEVVYRNCENTVALDIVRDIKNQVASYNFKTILIPGRKEENLREHNKILDAIKIKDAKLAEKYLKEHIHMILNTITNYSHLIS